MRRNRACGEFLDRLTGVPRHTVTDAAEPPASDPGLGFQYLAHPRAEVQVGVSNDPLGDAAGAITARGAHRSDAVDELDLADRRHFRRAVLPVHRSAFEKDRGDDIVPTAYVGHELRQQIAPRCGVSQK